MKMVVTSDWHLDWITSGLDRFDDVDGAVDDVVNYACTEGVDLFVFTGDLTNPDNVRSHRATAHAISVADSLDRNGVKSLWMPGNHDVIETGHGVTTLSALHEASRAGSRWQVVEKPGIAHVRLGDKDWTFGMLPFTERAFDYDPDQLVADWKANHWKIDAVFGHLCIAGIHPGSETTDMPRGRNVYLPIHTLSKCYPKAMLFNGHYHERQTFKGVHIPGSLERLTFGEETNEPGFLVVEL